MSKRPDISAGGVLEVLKSGPYREPAHNWLYEVGNATGFRCNRHADALVISVWPSRGLWIAGVEAKVSRSDWKKELDDPRKADAIQRYCDYWWVAAPEGVIELSEVPENWGLYVIDGKRAKVAKQAPKLDPEPMSLTFVTSVLRNASQGLGQAISNARAQEREKIIASAPAGSQAEVDELSRKVRQLQWDADRYPSLLETVKKFEKAAGLVDGAIEHGRYTAEDTGQLYRAALTLKGVRVARLAQQFEDVAAALRAAEASAEAREEQAAE